MWLVTNLAHQTDEPLKTNQGSCRSNALSPLLKLLLVNLVG